MSDSNKAPADADKAKAPDQTEGTGQAKISSEAPYQLPEKFKGQTAEQIAKSYIELEGKMGDQSKTVEEANKLKSDMSVLMGAIYANPDLYRQVQEGINKYVSGETIPEARKTESPKGDEEAKKVESSQISDLRTSQENQILDDFYSRFGYKNLPANERAESLRRLAVSLAELVDPSGNKPVKQILAEIPLSRLPRFLENAHFVANKENIIKQRVHSASLDKETNESATIGSFAASTGQGASEGVKLTNQERYTARKLGISEEVYAKRKSQIAEEAKRFER